MPVIDIDAVPLLTNSAYPQPFQARSRGKARRRLGDAGGLTQFGVNLKTLAPGAETALRHWHEAEDEFVWIVSGQATLIDNDGEHVMGPGSAAAFPAGDPNGHHIVNRSDGDVVLLEIGTRAAEETGHYPDDDLSARKSAAGYLFTHKDGSPYNDSE